MRKVIFWMLPVTVLIAIIIIMAFPQPLEIINYNDGPYFLKGDSDQIIMIKISGHQPDKPSIEYQYFSNDSIDLILKKNNIEKYRKENDRFKDSFKNINKVFAVGDVHGEYESLKKLLINNHIIDTNLKWIFKNNHLVFCGDVFDRGEQVTECLWLIYNLEQQAQAAKGAVHFILGNHEVMILTGNTKYLHEKYRAIQNKLNIPYSFLFNEKTLLGDWLRSKNTVIKINNILFLHGGIHPDIVYKNLSINEINNSIRGFLTKEKINANTSALLGMEGPLWYRGYISDDKLKSKDIRTILDYYSIHNIVFAHTTVNTISSFFDDRLIAIDVPMSKEEAYGLFITNGKFQPVDIQGKRLEIFKR